MEYPIFNNFSEIVTKEMTPGYFSKLIHTDTNTVNFLEVKAGSVSALHRHPHTQMAFVVEGIFEMTVEGEIRQLDSGQFVMIPSNALHGGTAITDCKLIDVFSPVREDYL
ncbi:cupin domain-containing protein [Mucilaginibacter myungsuensis]|uniref:Cupin domain-containing protein n=1 Tax=Mucilaginibacter myungsuensis TaxID=649104 RepID=A0A929KYA0_9SPHI|nr:cupin domain-containing protein [Mucilaginibacter myungsuensis]MBE9663896.1 cupin domain-containing protein [Mucilaginibacter myungsuensis]MDN3598388.1 cupin domain-containing protein [Mucilaginibacter myungsuensis]